MEMSPNSPLPFLAMVHWTGAQNQHPSATTLFSVADATPLGGGVRHGLEEELKNKSLCPTAQGWILVHEPEAATTYLLDAQSRQRIQLPDLAMEQRLIPYCSCLLAGAPTAAGCLVLLVEPAAAFIWYCRVGGGDWTKHEYDIGTAGDEYRADKKLIAPIAAYRGRFYFNAMATEMSVLELRPGAGLAFSSVATELADAERYKQALVFMVRTDEEEEEDLYKVVLLHNGGGFDKAKVFRMDFSEHRWCLVDDLGGRAFFVGQMYFGASCVPVAGDGIRRNCVYSLVAAKNTFRIFNLKEGTLEVQNLAPYEPMLETVGKSRLSWVLPTHPRA
uniref:Uncharacterized protein n=1 Tax=Avena sativa TaxID=4498 RepID=A0ACD5U4G0_AVESA